MLSSFPQRVYHFLPDRFARSDAADPTDVNFSDFDLFFGGSLIGAMKKLKYIRSLGFDGILVGPFLQNTASGYHGYHVTNCDVVDPRFAGVDGSGKDVLALRNEIQKTFQYVEPTILCEKQCSTKCENECENKCETKCEETKGCCEKTNVCCETKNVCCEKTNVCCEETNGCCETKNVCCEETKRRCEKQEKRAALHKTKQKEARKRVAFEYELLKLCKPLDFEKILKDFKEACNKEGLQVIFDFVPNHLHSSHPFVQSVKTNPEKRCWFFLNEKNEPYKFFFTFTELVKVNLKNPCAAAFMIEQAKRLAQYCDHLRVDHALGCDKCFLVKLCDELHKLKPNFKVFGEVWMSNFGNLSDDRFNLFLDTFDIFSPCEKREYIEMRKRGTTTIQFQKWGTSVVAGKSGDKVRCLDGLLDFTTYFLARDAFQNPSVCIGELVPQLDVPDDFVLISFIDNHDTNRGLFEARRGIQKELKRKTEAKSCCSDPCATKTIPTDPKEFFFRILSQVLVESQKKGRSVSIYSGTEALLENTKDTSKVSDNCVRFPMEFKSLETKKRVEEFAQFLHCNGFPTKPIDEVVSSFTK